MDKAMGIINSALKFGINPSLVPIQRMCELLGSPEQRYTCIQVGGTNGKSSTSRYLAAILRSYGFSTGLYLSPELVFITDRIEIKGVPVSDEDFAQAVIRVYETAEADGTELTEFEITTAAALLLFAEHEVEYAVLEVGLGGRWDATTVVDPVLAVFTGVDLDHTAILGDTIAEIAAEKAAIVKMGTKVVAAPTDPAATQVFKARAAEFEVPFIEVPPAETQEVNSYQAQNKLTAMTAARELIGADAFDEGKAQEAMDTTVVPGRLETLHTDPLVIIDAAHNPASAAMLARTLTLPEAILLLAILADKDATGIIEALVPLFPEIVVTQTSSPRAIPAHELAAQVESITGKAPQVFEHPEDALQVLLKQDLPVVATGSITLAGEVKRFFL